MTEPELGKITDLLQQEEFAIDRTSVETWSTVLEFHPLADLSNELAWLKELSPGKFHARGKEDEEWIKDPNASLPCGMKVFRLDNPLDQVQDLDKRPSKMMFERDFFDSLYRKITSLLQQKKRIILTGNSGIGKSWFQVFLLQRLLKESGENASFRLVVRQFGTLFYLMDLVSCRGWKISGSPEAIKKLLNALKKTLYLYEPGMMVDQPPLLTSAPSLSTLSPRPSRIEEYKKSLPVFLYMPVWELHELLAIAELERRNLGETEENFEMFGGIIRYTLGDSSVIKEAEEDLKRCCANARTELFRSIAADVDDSANADQQNNISGFLACYLDIPVDGDDAFATQSKGMTSAYAKKRIREKQEQDFLPKILRR